MFQDKARITGQVTARVYGPDGQLKCFPEHPVLKHFPLGIQRFAERMFGIPISGSPMEVTNYNIVTDEGDAMVADLCAQTPARTKVDNTNGYIEVGTGYVSETKAVTSCVTPTGSPEVMDATYPLLKGSWGAADDNVTQYRATFEAGDLNATGIDEAALLNGSTATTADCLAYAQITPAVNVTTADTLEVTWELTFTGA